MNSRFTCVFGVARDEVVTNEAAGGLLTPTYPNVSRLFLLSGKETLGYTIFKLIKISLHGL